MSRRTIQGVMFAVLAAMCFGVTAPTLSWLEGSVPPFSISTLLCVGLVLASFISGAFGENGPPLSARRIPRLLLSAVLGAVLSPTLLAFGLTRANGVAACLLLNLEAVFAAFLGVLLYRERIGWRFAVGITAITVGAIGLMTDGTASEEELLGLLAVAGATAMCAADNALNRPLARYDSSEVMFMKGMVGGTISALLALAVDDVPTAWEPLGIVILCGMVGFGATERCYLMALRALGVARTSSVFTISPFFGVAMALVGGAPYNASWGLAGLVMAFGVLLHATDGDPDPEPAPRPVPEPVRTTTVLSSAPTGPPARERLAGPSRSRRTTSQYPSVPPP